MRAAQEQGAEPSLEQLMQDADPEQLKFLLLQKEQQGMCDVVFRQALQLIPRRQSTETEPSLESLMQNADPGQLKYLLLQKEQQGMSDLVFRQALQLIPLQHPKEADPSLESLMRNADPEQLKYLLLHKEQQGMSDFVFRQALQLLPLQDSTAASQATSTGNEGVGVGLDVEGPVTNVPPAMTPEERVLWDRDGMFWRRGAFTRAQVQEAKQAIRAASAPEVSPLGMVSGPGARVFFADDPTQPSCITDLIAAPHVLGPLGGIVGDNVDYLYTKAVWKDAQIQTGFGWHWDHTYWGGAPKFSTWLALDDADESNGCLKLVPGSHRIIPELRARFSSKFQRTRDEEEDPWAYRSGKPVTKGDDFIIEEAALDEFLLEHSLCREAHPASAGDILYFSSFTLHSSYHNVAGSADRWALISTYRDAANKDPSKVFPRPRPVLRRGCLQLGKKAAAENLTAASEISARYIFASSLPSR